MWASTSLTFPIHLHPIYESFLLSYVCTKGVGTVDVEEYVVPEEEEEEEVGAWWFWGGALDFRVGHRQTNPDPGCLSQSTTRQERSGSILLP